MGIGKEKEEMMGVDGCQLAALSLCRGEEEEDILSSHGRRKLEKRKISHSLVGKSVVATVNFEVLYVDAFWF